MTPDPAPGAGSLLDVLASVLEMPAEEVAARLGESFFGLGGTSLDAMEVVDRAEEELGLTVDVGHLLGMAPLSTVLAACVPARVPPPAPAADRRPVLPEQESFLSAERLIGAPMHHVSGAELTGPLDEEALWEAVRLLVARHESLRTVFEETEDGHLRHVLPDWRPGLVRLEPPRYGRRRPGGGGARRAGPHLRGPAGGRRAARRRLRAHPVRRPPPPAVAGRAPRAGRRLVDRAALA
ncbi:hypothetical protein GCM10018953_51700 [Streptosporangium nondiastaticum]|uniref:phosphopantetheine-binding protein n=1 Tax=Streptosporangium nondiastaticum TaxID=35764 RepID=UPI0031FA29AC